MKLHYISLLYYSSSSTETVTVLMHHRVSEEHMTTCAFMFKASAQLPLKSWRGLHAWWVLIPSFPSAIRSLSTPVIAHLCFANQAHLVPTISNTGWDASLHESHGVVAPVVQSDADRPRRYIFYAGGSLAGTGYCRQCRRRPAILLSINLFGNKEPKATYKSQKYNIQ